MATIKDIAEECKVSIATVSKALNGHDDVAEKTKRRISETARALGYTPNSWARALKTNCTYNLGVLFAERAGSGLTHSYFSQVLNSFKSFAESKGYDVTFIGSRFGSQHLTYLEHCKCRGFDGLFICCADDFTDEQVTELFKSDLPVVSLDYEYAGKPAVFSDNNRGMRELIQYAYSRGHRKIAYIYGDTAAVTAERVRSFTETLKSLNIDPEPGFLVQGRYLDTEAAEILTDKLLSLPEPPTCIIMTDDFAAIGGLNAISKRGLSVPADVSVMGYDGIPTADVLNPKLTTYRQDASALGKEAAKKLLKVIADGKISEPTFIEGYLVEGASVKLLYEC
ncbi:MAG: LacI family transcriptional regulator [Ruminococcus sp.]|jgi:DNA-binding LacI/PurR family transcriptional regulator|nr:LacI family transcriptional regulator [Ruminococcus sp.]